ncbi:MAG: hypothetical protein LBC61_06005 [Candidatus Peribacteria bacterium]|nr:hypothetical protein [Candidatus Peribacteria bacterium]
MQKIKNGKEIKSKLDILVRNLSDKTLNIINNNLSKANFNKKEFAKYKDIFDYLKHFARYEVFLRANK